MKFLDGISFNQARAYVNKQEAFWREDYMSSDLYRDMTFDEYIEVMGITEYRDSLKKALKELMEQEKVSEVKHCIEITEELFYMMKNSGDASTNVVQSEKYTDVFYFKYGVTFFVRTQNGYCNYYIQDINA